MSSISLFIIHYSLYYTIASFWLSDWGLETTMEQFTSTRGYMAFKRNIFYLNGYAGMQMATVFMLFVSRFSLVGHRVAASKIYHELLLNKVLASPVSFFDVTPIGRYFSRFSIVPVVIVNCVFTVKT